MVDPLSIGSAISGLQTASNTVKTIVEAKGTIDFQSKAIELQTQILAAQTSALAAQSDQTALLAEISDLKAKIAEIEDWEAEAEKYDLTEIGSGNFAFVLKEGVKDSAPTHYLCANCFEQRRKSILQPETRMPGRCEVLACPSCGFDAYIHGHWNPEHAKRQKGRM